MKKIVFVLANLMILFFALGKFTGPLKMISGGFLMHTIAFFTLSLIMSIMNVKLHYGFIYTTIFAVAIEILQLFTGYRHFSLMDIAAGMMGSAIYSLMAAIAIEISGVRYGTA